MAKRFRKPPDSERGVQFGFEGFLTNPPTEPKPLTEMPKSPIRDPEQSIINMHNMFQPRKMKARRARDKFDGQTASRQYQKWLEAIGAMTPKELTHYIQEESSPPFARFLELSGLGSRIDDEGLTSEVVEEIGRAAKEAMQLERDLWDSTGITIYGSPYALLADQAGLHEILPKNRWVRDYRARKEG